jgi:hypothetical protein
MPGKFDQYRFSLSDIDESELEVFGVGRERVGNQKDKEGKKTEEKS